MWWTHIFALEKEIFYEKEVESKSGFGRQFLVYSKIKRSVLCLFFFSPRIQGSKDQENTGEGSKILERGVSRYSNMPTRGFMANEILQSDRLSFREKAKGRKAPTIQQKE